MFVYNLPVENISCSSSTPQSLFLSVGSISVDFVRQEWMGPRLDQNVPESPPAILSCTLRPSELRYQRLLKQIWSTTEDPYRGGGGEGVAVAMEGETL